ncbi:histone-lysine N-methyltransferase ATXR7 isoform X2 [Quillaja saponaria]|uniref:Histone-lysine N-methyltransferase ATXR7 isoform X2 n=1 Tax=Quillaja saponaria TaxID=32244 RepID=A0AAD7PSX4_QUISA|nr:histone-lysine N-methyltransferase ATXR7 isoform X2 [Quillaja saponaria]
MYFDEGGMLLHDQSCIDEGLTYILKSVEDQLHSSAKVSLAVYVQCIVEEEVKKLISSSEDDTLDEEVGYSSMYCNHDCEHNSSEVIASERSSAKILSDKFVIPLQAAELFCQSLFGNLLSEFSSSSLEDLCANAANLVNDREIDDPLPPGFEENGRLFVPSYVCRFQPSRLVMAIRY